MKKLITILAILIMAATVNATDLRWDGSGEAEGYTVYYSDAVGTEFNYDAGTNLFVTDIDFKLGLAYGATYSFVVKAYNDAGESDPSNSISYTTDDAYVPPKNSVPIRVSRPATITIIIE